MKRNQFICAIAFLSFLCHEAHAQSSLINGFPECEFFISGNRTLITSQQFDAENRNGWGFGINIRVAEIKPVTLYSGLSFEKTSQFRNSEYVSLGTGYQGDVIWNFKSLTLPAKARVNIGEKLQFYAEAGMCGVITLHAFREATGHWVELVNGKPVFQHSYRERNDFELRKFNFGFVSGAGISVPVSGIRFFAAFDYIYLFGEIEDRTPDIHNRYLRINIGISI
ncbi:MAG: hypothetical protein IPH20_03790 [Bacteroidales bacterium]|nr:hypothetical protein [Bacteroidales bacterium]